MPAIYASLDPATTILEVAVHAGFKTLDTVSHTLIEIEVLTPKLVHIVQPSDVPNPNWLRPGSVGAGQQAFGKGFLVKYPFVLVPCVISTHSWNLLINPTLASGKFKETSREIFAMDPRLHKPAS